jgi:putative sterol carrier protein
MPSAHSDFTARIPANLASNPERARSVDAVFAFRIVGEGGGVWTLFCKDEVGVREGEHPPVDCILECSAEDWQLISENTEAGMELFFTGRLVLTGNVALAARLPELLG